MFSDFLRVHFRGAISRSEMDGLAGLLVDNLLQFLMAISLCPIVLSVPPSFILARVIPGMAIAVAAGCLYFAHRARLGQGTAMPYGVSTVALLGILFLVMAPAKASFMERGLAPDAAGMAAWQVGVAAALVLGVLLFVGAFAAPWLTKTVPHAALMAPLGGIALGFLAGHFFAIAFATPLVALVPMFILLAGFLTPIRFPLGLPGTAWALVAGVGAAWIAWAMGLDHVAGAASPDAVHLAVDNLHLVLPIPVVGDIIAGFRQPILYSFIVPVVVPLAISNILGTVQNLAAAKDLSDDYDVRGALKASSLANIIGTLFGSCFPTTVYIGHAGWKDMGAKWHYANLNGLILFVLALCGGTQLLAQVLPLSTTAGILVWVGLMMVTHCYRSSPQKHWGALTLGLLPLLAAWATSSATSAVSKVTNLVELSAAQQSTLHKSLSAHALGLGGLVALAQGALLLATLWTAVAVAIIERQWMQASLWFLGLAGLAALGLIHSGTLEPSGVIAHVGTTRGIPWAMAYLVCAALCPFLGRINHEREA